MKQGIVSRNAVLALALVALLAGAGMLVGCSGQQGQGQPQSVSNSASAGSVAIGEKADGAKMVAMKNAIGSDISNVAVAPTGSQDQPVTLPIDGGTWANNQDASLYYGAAGDADTYQMVITSNGTVYTLHSVAFAAMQNATLMVDGDVAYLAYEQNGAPVSTLEAERALLPQASAGQASSSAAASSSSSTEAAGGNAAGGNDAGGNAAGDNAAGAGIAAAGAVAAGAAAGAAAAGDAAPADDTVYVDDDGDTYIIDADGNVVYIDYYDEYAPDDEGSDDADNGTDDGTDDSADGGDDANDDGAGGDDGSGDYVDDSPDSTDDGEE